MAWRCFCVKKGANLLSWWGTPKGGRDVIRANDLNHHQLDLTRPDHTPLDPADRADPVDIETTEAAAD